MDKPATASSTTTTVFIIAIIFIVLIILLFISNRTSITATDCVLEISENVSATSDEKSTIVVGWDKVEGVTEYKVLRSCQEGFSISAATNVGVTRKTSFIFNNVGDTNNYIKVIASSSTCDNSRPSKEVQVIVNCTADETELNVNHTDDGANVTQIKWTHIANVKSYRYQIIPYTDGSASPGIIIDETIDNGFPDIGNEIILSFLVGDLPIGAGETYQVHIYPNNACGFGRQDFLFIK